MCLENHTRLLSATRFLSLPFGSFISIEQLLRFRVPIRNRVWTGTLGCTVIVVAISQPLESRRDQAHGSADPANRVRMEDRPWHLDCSHAAIECYEGL